MGNKGNQTRNYIKEKAYDLFAKKGFKDITMKDICEATGFSRGGLYRHFSSTAEIFEEIFMKLTKDTEDEMARWIEEKCDAREMLEETMVRYKREIEEKDKSLSLAVYEYSQAISSEFFRELNRTSKEKWSRFIEYGIESGAFNCVPVAQTVDLILYAYQGARMWSSILPVDEGISEHITQSIWDILVGKKEE